MKGEILLANVRIKGDKVIDRRLFQTMWCFWKARTLKNNHQSTPPCKYNCRSLKQLTRGKIQRDDNSSNTIKVLLNIKCTILH